MNKPYLETGRIHQKQKTRNKILSSAKKYLIKGQDFTLEDIAKNATLSRATIYRYYSNVEVLSREAGLDLHTKSPESIVEPLLHKDTDEILMGIQDYFNFLAMENEAAFRKYLSVVVASNAKENIRGARRIKTLQLALQKNDFDLSQSEYDKLIVVATVLMGIEALIVTKDVCRLNNQRSSEVLQWGLEMILKGLPSGKPV